jgi:hypothetical protein
MAQLQAKNYPPEFSSDGGTTWKTLVCTQDWELTGTNTVNKEDTFCGQVVGVGIPGFAGSANAVCETAPTSGSQVSYEDVLGWFVGSTAVNFRVQDPASGSPGTNFYTTFSCYITGLTQSFASGEVIKFSVQWESTGTIDITP